MQKYNYIIALLLTILWASLSYQILAERSILETAASMAYI